MMNWINFILFFGIFVIVLRKEKTELVPGDGLIVFLSMFGWILYLVKIFNL